MSKEDELREILDQTAKEISQVDHNPRTWLSWMVYLLGRLDRLSMDVNPNDRQLYKEMLRALQGAIRDRLNRGGW
jgi:hypothetical protein